MASVVPNKTGSSDVAWCFETLGLQRGALPAEVRRSYLERARETHPDKGGSPAEFRRVVDAFNVLANGEASAAPIKVTSPRKANANAASGPRRFTLDEVSRLAEQLRQMNMDKCRAERAAVAERHACREERRRRSQQSALRQRTQQEADRLRQSLRSQGRSDLPPGVEPHTSSSAGVTPGRSPVLFRATLDVAGKAQCGPPRSSVAEAESDFLRVEKAKQHCDDTALRALERLRREAPR
eukprot:CAMPEP_0170620694 /NCGR_PEP_ID=MMETSP0224-20130122/28194_1 /TAXON_ID=285029 /ORGANISM="Togula jolla, Strain CCCM 725" /LENGTH=238 /DNA_ID=CAMNT_0010946883 /DNA_START=26 /DNA_END=739 /DNA_ORIENTATION=-